MPNNYFDEIAFDDIDEITEEDESEFYSTATEDNDDRYVDLDSMSIKIREAAEEYSEEALY